MAVQASLTVAPSSPAHGDTVTATYSVTGNDPIPPSTGTVHGVATVGGQALDVQTTITLPGTPAASESFAVPTMSGLTFVATANPRVFTALVP